MCLALCRVKQCSQPSTPTLPLSNLWDLGPSQYLSGDYFDRHQLRTQKEKTNKKGGGRRGGGCAPNTA